MKAKATISFTKLCEKLIRTSWTKGSEREWVCEEELNIKRHLITLKIVIDSNWNISLNHETSIIVWLIVRDSCIFPSNCYCCRCCGCCCYNFRFCLFSLSEIKVLQRGLANARSFANSSCKPVKVKLFQDIIDLRAKEFIVFKGPHYLWFVVVMETETFTRNSFVEQLESTVESKVHGEIFVRRIQMIFVNRCKRNGQIFPALSPS